MTERERYYITLPYVLWKSPSAVVLYRLMCGELFRLWDESCSPKIVSAEYESNNIAVLLPDGTLRVYRDKSTETINAHILASGTEKINAVVVNKDPLEVFCPQSANVYRVLVKDNVWVSVGTGEVLSHPLSVTRAGKTVGFFRKPSETTRTLAVFGEEITPLPVYGRVVNPVSSCPHWVAESPDNRASKPEARYYIQTPEGKLGEIITSGSRRGRVPFVSATVENEAAIVVFPFLGDYCVTAIYNSRKSTPQRAYLFGATWAHIEVCSTSLNPYYFYVAPWHEREIHVFDSVGDYCHSYILGEDGVKRTVTKSLQECNDINRTVQRQEAVSVTKNNLPMVLAAMFAAPEYPYAREIRGETEEHMPHMVSLIR